MVKVELALEGHGLLLRGEDPVEAVLAEDGHLPLVVVDLVLAEQLHDLAAHRRLVTQKENKKKRRHGKPAGLWVGRQMPTRAPACVCVCVGEQVSL